MRNENASNSSSYTTGLIAPVELSSLDHGYLELMQLCETVAKSRASCLIQGESGSGKKTLAQYIHLKSQRANKPFQIFNCKELSLGEQETEFKKSLDAARGGTLLIAEASRMSNVAQGRLFQAMQEGLDIRFIATSSRSLAQLVKQNEFREDLYYRLNVVNLKIPSLTERMLDIEMLSQNFARKWSDVHGKAEPKFTADAVQMLTAQRWPGNIRELESVIERAVLLNLTGEIRARDLQIAPQAAPIAEVQMSNTAWKPGRTLDEIERNVILDALKHHDGNRTHTAKALGISIRTLRNKLAEYRVMGINA
jgi:two-component system response regulator FlrC